MEVPGAGRAFEFVVTAVVELDVGSDNCGPDGVGDEDPRGEVADSLGDADCEAGHVVVAKLDFARVKPGAYFEADGLRAFDDLGGAADGPTGAVEGREESVSGGQCGAAFGFESWRAVRGAGV